MTQHRLRCANEIVKRSLPVRAPNFLRKMMLGPQPLQFSPQLQELDGAAVDVGVGRQVHVVSAGGDIFRRDAA
jgi:hypothetical protein